MAMLAGNPGVGLAGPRVAFFGSPGTDRILRLAPVQAAGSTEFRLRFENTSGQTFNQVQVLFGDNAPATASGAPSYPSLPAGASVTGVFGPNAADCIFDARTLDCDFGHVPSKPQSAAVRQVTIVVDVGSNTTIAVWAAAVINETQGSTNTDTFFAEGSTSTFTGNSENVGGVIEKDLPAGLSTAIGANGLGFSIALNRASTGSDALALREGLGDFSCAPFTCFGPPIQMFVNFGDTENIDLTVTSGSPSTKYAGFLHKLDDGTIVDVVNSKSNACSAKITTNCIVVSKQGVLTVRIPQNGSGRVR
jgi:hypothetical protein